MAGIRSICDLIFLDLFVIDNNNKKKLNTTISTDLSIDIDTHGQIHTTGIERVIFFKV